MKSKERKGRRHWCPNKHSIVGDKLTLRFDSQHYEELRKKRKEAGMNVGVLRRSVSEHPMIGRIVEVVMEGRHSYGYAQSVYEVWDCGWYLAARVLWSHANEEHIIDNMSCSLPTIVEKSEAWAEGMGSNKINLWGRG